ncbi:hypothetical protein OIDMADRAFT_108403, partial [Oidiodendron maius Zn]
CNEVRPECANCHDYRQQCSFASDPPASSEKKLRCHETQPTSGLEMLPSQSRNTHEGFEIHVPLQMHSIPARKLLHHYSTTVYETLSTIPSQQKEWRTSVLHIAFQHSFLLRAVLAMSALHLAHVEGNMAAQFIREAAIHQQAALTEFRPLVNTLNFSPEILRSLFLSSCFLSMSAFGMPRIEGRFKLTGAANIEDFLTCANLVRGMTALLERWQESILHIGMGDLTHPGIQSETLLIIKSEPQAELIALSDLCTSCNAELCVEARLAYIQAVRILHEQFVHLARLPRSGYSRSPVLFALTWPAIIPQKYLDLLKVQKPQAIVILAYYGYYLYRLDFFWCFQGWGAHLVRTSISALGTTYEESLAWPRAVIELG